jgi:hypothetical protein
MLHYIIKFTISLVYSITAAADVVVAILCVNAVKCIKYDDTMNFSIGDGMNKKN